MSSLDSLPTLVVTITMEQTLYGFRVARVREQVTRRILATQAFTPYDYAHHAPESMLLTRAITYANLQGWIIA